ncbi:hypothetical protein C4B63_2g321 [Trypanosoma cruzi]|uniref:Uncharacterized protein n=1 Tax=Trypanosoma cruzi TaxID=5693 RepID=A0A2V2W557_TRYCR|nr:hypothetical protein C4B63_2g321 [Trypanosoma cruzi]
MTVGSLYAFGRGVVLPLCGFATGWVAYRAVEERGLIDESYLRRIRLGNLTLQLYLQQHVLPVAFTEKYGYPEEFLKTMIERLGRGDDADNEVERQTFEQILRECDLNGQIAWLEEHVLYDIPYFYIADIFDGWCALHRSLFTTADEGEGKESDLTRRGDNSDALLQRYYAGGWSRKHKRDIPVRRRGAGTLCSCSGTYLKRKIVVTTDITHGHCRKVRGLFE